MGKGFMTHGSGKKGWARHERVCHDAWREKKIDEG